MNISKMTNAIGIMNTLPMTAPVEPRGAGSAAEAGNPVFNVSSGGISALGEPGGVESVDEAALRRDDALGRLVDLAFAMPAPPMPDFSRM